jgi:tRNA pseudouridine55 synthase
MFSAIKVGGKKLYELARKGKTVEREARSVWVKQIRRLSDVEYTDGCACFSFSAVVSKGTYIRTLCVEIGNRMGYPAHMSALNRTKSGNFRIEDAYTLSDIESGAYRLLGMKEALKHFPILDADAALSQKILHGIALSADEVRSTEPVVVFASSDRVLGIYIYREGLYRSERVWN